MLTRRALTLFPLLFAVGCGPAVHVTSAHDPAARHGTYETFAMIEPNRPVHTKSTDVDPFVMLRLRQLTYLGLREKGVRPAAKKEADLLVAVNAARDEEIYVYNTGPYFYDPFYGPVWSSPSVARVDEGIVVIDLIDREKQSVVWRGTGVREIGRSFDEEELQEMVRVILAEYPKGAAKEP